jgi:hypothetical protein
MLARRLLAVLVVELAAYAWLATVLHSHGWHWLAIGALIAVLHVVVLRGSTVLLGFAIAWFVGGRSGPPLGPVAVVRLVAGELRAFWLNYMLVPFERWVPPEPPLERVVLVHGILCNRAVWYGFARRLRALGLRARAVTVEPLLDDIDAMADDLARQLEGAAAPVVVVAHSLGGLVARRMLQEWPSAPVAGLITIATPHAGSVQAALAFGRAGTSLRRTSPWLRALNGGTLPPDACGRVTFWSWHDELVSPPESCRWQGCREHAYAGIGHIALLWSDAVAAEVAGEIRTILAGVDAGVPAVAPAGGPEGGAGTRIGAPA